MTEDEASRVQLQNRLQELGKRYLARTAVEVQSLQKTLAGPQGEQLMSVEVAQIAHRIHGSGAMLGFTAITEYARVLDGFMKTRGDAPLNGQEREYVQRQLAGLLQVIEQAMQEGSRLP